MEYDREDLAQGVTALYGSALRFEMSVRAGQALFRWISRLAQRRGLREYLVGLPAPGIVARR